ncbi:flagellar basal body rod protein FlgB [Shewanella sp. NKUCC05_KAH]|jgi:flagellar basal-body rod protein FlgB|uniref:Flagellar basal body rod protein FlgB n=1 Tax=Shewanella oncorhynchi TaxID=2726434 RepID=A0ABX1KP30_9GAMM|nr:MULTISPECIES: flagellar basal body rod protein FlgB [Shewanella]MBI1675410.1 flagellar basal body rod protein FlgB [Shewanella sp. DW31]MBW3528410.1 flagellar basal body rod protein FlgB [Shewanella sp. NKUCC05_KAH]MBW3532873.1 flagellar basal body rod protein FlgB [Shewanella sp. NKUCC06_TVS]MCU7963879.1 flagellar basal body rod protein FlgB [Shewanella sp. SW32]MCU7972382.1 flagellar basal body rod protein FlgB [Shewanella sp. SW29]
MAINLDKALGIHPQTLDFRVERSKVLASNLINAETPGYKARDLDFKAAMKQVEAGMQMNQEYNLAYRMPYQNSADDNTVELGKEQARYSQNAMDYQTSLTFLNMKIAGLKSAIEGR